MDTDKQMQDIKQEAIQENIPVVLDEVAGLLAMQCQDKKPKNILEIGTAVGYSATLMLLNSGDESVITTIEINEQSFLKARENFENMGIEPRVYMYHADAAEVLPWLDDKYDFIFLDGPKAQYIKYLPYLKKLLSGGGTLFADDVLFMGMVDEKVPTPVKKRSIVNSLKAFIEDLQNDSTYSVEIIEKGDGVLIATKLEDK